MTSAKLGAIVTSCLVIMYVALLSNTAFALLQSRESLSVLIGALLLVFPVVAIWSIIKELFFGLKVERLAKQLQSENLWPEFHFEVRPSGRPVKASADSEFQRFREAALNAPEDWRSWFVLGLAYDAASDRPRARASMRKAIKLHG
ncbi:MAG: hypothetical protein ACKOOD_05070 [Microbacteriaceae bacterium]